MPSLNVKQKLLNNWLAFWQGRFYMSRGVVVAPSFTVLGGTLQEPDMVGIDPVNLKHCLLYWDKIDYPNNNITNIATNVDEEFLIDAGVLSRSNIHLQDFSGFIGSADILAQSIAFQQRNKQEPGSWTIAQSCKNLLLPETYSTEEQTIEIELYKTLPSPGNEVSFDDILTFKEKRRAELVAFRSLMDELYLQIIGSADIPRAKTMTMKKLENAIKDLHAAANESWTSKLISGFKVELNIPNLAVHALAGAALASSFGVSPKLGAAIGAIRAAIKFEFTSAPKSKGLPDNLKDYAYLNYIEREFRS